MYMKNWKKKNNYQGGDGMEKIYALYSIKNNWILEQLQWEQQP